MTCSIQVQDSACRVHVTDQQTQHGRSSLLFSGDGVQFICSLTHVQGQGIARQREAIVNGLRDSVGEFTADVPSVDSKVRTSVLPFDMMPCHAMPFIRRTTTPAAEVGARSHSSEN